MNGVPELASLSVKGIGDTVTVDFTTVTDRDADVYIALQALTCSVIVINFAAASSNAATVSNRAAALRQCMLPQPRRYSTQGKEICLISESRQKQKIVTNDSSWMMCT